MTIPLFLIFVDAVPRGLGNIVAAALRPVTQHARSAAVHPSINRKSGRRGSRIPRDPLLPGLLGLVGTCLVVATAGRLALREGVEPPTGWLGLLAPVHLDRASALPAFMLTGVALTLGAWLYLCLLASRGVVSLRGTVIILAGWFLPAAAGPPILSLDVYSYVAQGAMLNADLNPYRSGPIILGDHPSLLASDPVWRMSRAPYGPLALGLLKAVYALSGDSVLAAVVILRIVAFAGVVIIVACVTRAADPPRRPLAVAVAASPIMIMQLLGAVHLEAIMVALLSAGLLAARARRPALALVLLTSAAAVKWPAAFAIVAVIVWHAVQPSPARTDESGWAHPSRRTRPFRWAHPSRCNGVRSVARDAAVVTVSGLFLVLLVPDGLGWLRSVSTPAAGLTLYAPTVGLADALTRLGDITNARIEFAEALSVTRTAGIVLTAAVMLRLLATIRGRDIAATVGWGLLTLSVLGPVLYPWYLTWGLLPLAMAMNRQRLRVVITVSAIGAFLALPHCELLFADLPGATPWLQRQAPAIAISTLTLVSIFTVALVRWRDDWSGAATLER